MKARHVNLIPRSPLRFGLLCIPLGLACFAISPQVQAGCQEGCFGNNTFLGEGALLNNTGFSNTAVGYETLFSSTSGSANVAVGSQALTANTTGAANTAIGDEANLFNTTGSDNTAVGFTALQRNSSGSDNTVVGVAALSLNTTGGTNTAIGELALIDNTTGSSNTAIGYEALNRNTIGGSNIALGVSAGSLINHGSNNIDIGNTGKRIDTSIIRIGTTGTQQNTFIAGISGVSVAGGVGVIVDTNGQLGTVVSSERFKDGIKPMDRASEAILALKPVTFRYKHELDPKGIPQFGLVAEQVEKVDPDLVANDEQGKPYTVRYEAVNAMLLNEFLKEHRKVEEQDCKLQDQEATVAELKKQVAALTAGLQKVNVQLN